MPMARTREADLPEIARIARETAIPAFHEDGFLMCGSMRGYFCAYAVRCGENAHPKK